MNRTPPRAAPRVTVNDIDRFTRLAVSVEHDSLPISIDMSEVIKGRGYVFDTEQLKLATRLVRAIFARQDLTADRLADASIIISEHPFVFVPRSNPPANHSDAVAWARRTAAVAAAIAASFWAQRARLTPTALPLEELVSFLLTNDRDGLVGAISTYLRPAPSKPNLVILTPLGGIDDDEQEALLRFARVIEDRVKSAVDVCVLVPGETIHPSTDSDDDDLFLYMSARSKVLDADYVVIVAGTHDSWGNASCVSWVESLNTEVMVFRDGSGGFSKVLSRSYFRTRVVPSVDAHTDAETVLRDVVEKFPQILRHSANREDFFAAILPQMPVLEELITIGGPESELTLERLQSLSSNPSEVQSLSVVELIAIRRALDDRAADLTRIVLGDLGASSIEDEITESLADFVGANPDVTAIEAVAILTDARDLARRGALGIAASQSLESRFWIDALGRLRARNG